MKITTICFLIKDGDVLLAMKKRGFGVGKWNGVGGKVKDGEDIKAAAMREIQEEIGVIVDQSYLEEFGTLNFSYHDNPDWDNFCHIFLINRWRNEPSESEEMRPRWFKKNELPFPEMWIDDPFWLPRVLAGEKIKAEFLFGENGTKVIDFSVSEQRAAN